MLNELVFFRKIVFVLMALSIQFLGNRANILLYDNIFPSFSLRIIRQGKDHENM